MELEVKCDEVFIDCIFGRKVKCFGFKWMMDKIWEGDIIYVVWLVRFGCSMKDFMELVEKIMSIGVVF